MNILGEVCMKKRLSVLLSIIIVLSICAPITSVMAEEARKQSALKTGKEIAALCNEYDNYSNSNDGDKIDNRLIVKTNDNIDEYGAVDSVYGFGYAFLQYADDESAEFAKTQYENAGYTADYDSVITTSSTSIGSSGNWSDEWAYEETDAVSALDYYKSKIKPNINIAILDSGINYNHELFKNRVVRTNADFATGTDDEMDKYGHGTNVAGAIAKSTPSNVKLSCYKIHNQNGEGTSAMALAAFEYIKQLSNKPDIINCSFVTRSGLGTVVDELVDMGITVVAGAGNEGKEVYQQPAIFDSAITVAATNRYGSACGFSNYGSCVDIAAPGDYVYTADMSSNTAYEFASGTSLATPLVSAAAAYVLMENRKYTPEQVKQELIATATPFKKSSCYYGRYGAGIVNFSNIINGTRCKDVTANYISGAYRDNISVELKCANSLVDIYYTTDGTLPTEINGTKYTAPIDVTDSTRIIAAAFARAGSPFHSKFTYLDYYILEDGESEFVINNDGIIKAYLGNEANIVVPDVVNGKEPRKIGPQVFSNSNIETITLPDTIESIGDDAFSNTNLKSVTANNLCFLNKKCFYNCNQLSDIDLSKVKEIGSEALYGCKSLPKQPDFSSVDWVAEKGLAGTYFNIVNLPNCTKTGENAFDSCKAEEIIMNKATSIGAQAFYNCSNLKTLYIPNATGLANDNFNGCTNIKLIFAPKIKSLRLSIPSNVTIYAYRLTSASLPQKYLEYKYTIISPEYEPWMNNIPEKYQSSITHIISDDIAQSKGAQIRTKDNGLRFGFAFDENSIGFDFKKYAENIEYGFVYTYKSLNGLNDFQKNDSLRANDSTVYTKSANKRNVEGTVSTYNAVFTGITKDHYNNEITARAYVCIDGMYFYSPVITRSYSSASSADDYVGIEEADNDIVFVHEHSFVKSLIAPKCEEKGYTLYKCAKCNESYTENYIDALGHNYKFVSADNSELTYKCSDCDSTVTKTKSELPIFIDYVNTKVVRGNDNMYLDLNNDGYINAKDYALLNKI